MATIACVVIASASREALLDSDVIPSLHGQGFDEIVVVGDYHSGVGYRHLLVPPIWESTNDALVKRDVGTVATSSEWLVYLSDDHALDPNFCRDLRTAILRDVMTKRSIGVPTRFTMRDDERIRLPMGLPDYCGGHAGVFHRTAIADVPWTVGPWHPNWDAMRSQILHHRGYRHVELPCIIEDVDDRPDARPWE